jgi:hypothetical protein
MMSGRGIPVQAYLSGSSERIDAVLYIRSTKAIVVSAPSIGSKTIHLKDVRHELEPYGNEMMLEVNDSKIIFAREYASEIRKKLWPKWDWRRSPLATCVLAGIGIVGAVFVLGLVVEAVMPMTLKRLFSERVRIQMGVCNVDNPALTHVHDSFDVKPTAVYVASESLPNAFALPDQTIVFTEGILQMMTPESFLGVYAHELGHLELGHTSKLLGRFDLFGRLFESLFGDTGKIIGSLALNKFSRDQEAAADKFSRDFLIRHDIDPHPTAKLFKTLNEGDIFSRWMAFMSTHPSYESRVEFFEELSVKKPKEYLTDGQWASIRNGCGHKKSSE